MFWRVIKNYIPPNWGKIYLFWRNIVTGLSLGGYAEAIAVAPSNNNIIYAASFTRIYKFGSMLLNTPDAITAAGNLFQIYPNPAASAISITATNNQQHPATVTLTDLKGKIIRKETMHFADELTLSVGELSEGIYMVKVEGDSFVEMHRVVVMK